MKLKEIDRTAMQAWSPAQQHPIYLATGEFWVAAVRWLWLEVICLFVLGRLETAVQFLWGTERLMLPELSLLVLVKKLPCRDLWIELHRNMPK